MQLMAVSMMASTVVQSPWYHSFFCHVVCTLDAIGCELAVVYSVMSLSCEVGHRLLCRGQGSGFQTKLGIIHPEKVQDPAPHTHFTTCLIGCTHV